MYDRQPNLLEDIRAAVGCTYISDLRADLYRSHAIYTLQHTDLSKYSPKALSDVTKYLLDISIQFVNIDEAIAFFARQ